MVQEIKKLTNSLLSFYQAMLNRLLQKHDQGWRGWDDEETFPDSEVIARAKAAIDDGRYVDAANLLMFVWIRNPREK